MVVADLDFGGINPLPSETDSPLIINPDGMQACSVSLEGLKAISRRNSQIGKLSGRINLDQLAQRDACYSGISSARSSLMKPLRLGVFE
jgi:hypothetical protein